MRSWGCTVAYASGNWDTQGGWWQVKVTSDKGNIPPNMLKIAWTNNFLIVFILNNNLKKQSDYSTQPAP